MRGTFSQILARVKRHTAGSLAAAGVLLCPLSAAAAPAAMVSGGSIGATAVAYTVSGSPLTAFYVLGFELGPWQDYLARELTPDMDLDEQLPEPRISWFQAEEVLILPTFARGLMDDSTPVRSFISFNIESQFSAQFSPLQSAEWLPGGGNFGDALQRQFLVPGFRQALGEDSILGVSAVLAYQRFSAANLGFIAADQRNSGLFQPLDMHFTPYQESSYGTGVRLGLRSELLPGIAMDAGYRSRIDMESFAAYRGVYSEPADLDVPARATVGLEFQASEQTWLTMGVDRVLYSELNTFANRNLPSRFNSLLGDSTSPTFAWDDLTIFSVGWRWRNTADYEFWFDVTTRSQPSPTSAVLSRALDEELADNSVLLGFSRPAGRSGRFSLAAAYAPPEFAFGGSVLGVTSDELDQSLEVEALLAWSF